MKNGIYLVATPIGNLEDITLRGLEVLRQAEVIACEDTRVAKKLLSLLNITIKAKKFIAVHDHNEAEMAQKIIDEAKQKAVAYISDAGSPLISDPGYKLVQEARQQNVYITTIPGACAVICALQLSGLPANSFMFCGFIPNKEKGRIDFLSKYKSMETTLIFYERADRLVKTLETIADIFSDREVSVVREISKIHEECMSATAVELKTYFEQNHPKGEIVILIAPAQEENYIGDYTAELAEELKKNNLKTAVGNMVKRFNLNRNEVYKTALEIKNHG